MIKTRIIKVKKNKNDKNNNNNSNNENNDNNNEDNESVQVKAINVCLKGKNVQKAMFYWNANIT